MALGSDYRPIHLSACLTASASQRLKTGNDATPFGHVIIYNELITFNAYVQRPVEHGAQLNVTLARSSLQPQHNRHNTHNNSNADTNTNNNSNNHNNNTNNINCPCGQQSASEFEICVGMEFRQVHKSKYLRLVVCLHVLSAQ